MSKRTSDYRASRKSKIAFNADKNTYELNVAGKSKRFPSGIVRRAIRKLEYINLAYTIDGDAYDVELTDYHYHQKGGFAMTIKNNKMRLTRPTHPGEMLREDFMPDYDLTVTVRIGLIYY